MFQVHSTDGYAGLMEITLYKGDTIYYTIPNDDTHRANTCHTGCCVDRLHDGYLLPFTGGGQYWLANGVNTGNVASRAWFKMDLGTRNAECVGKIGVWNLGYSNNNRHIATFDLHASDSITGSWVTLLSNAALNADAQYIQERQVTVPNCFVRRYVKFTAKTVPNFTRSSYIVLTPVTPFPLQGYCRTNSKANVLGTRH
jgi:hypothetical protein